MNQVESQLICSAGEQARANCAHKIATARQEMMLAQVRALEQLICDLKKISDDLAVVTRCSDALALDAEREAMRAGENDGAIAQVVSRVRMMTALTGEVGRRVADETLRVNQMIAATCCAAGLCHQAGDAAPVAPEQVFGAVRAGLGATPLD